MKKLFFLVLVFAGFMACENESIKELPQETSVTEDMNARMGDKIDVCHYDAENDSWHVINISANAWEGHKKHGDVMLIDADGDGWVANANECVPGGDCNDDDPNVNPGAEEICGDGIDNNCDGEIDEGCEDCSDCDFIDVLNSIDLTDACTVNRSGGLTSLFVYDESFNFIAGIDVYSDGSWVVVVDNNLYFGDNSSIDCVNCFYGYLDSLNLQTCGGSEGARSSVQNETLLPIKR